MRVIILGLRELGGFNGSDLGLGRMCVINSETLWLVGWLVVFVNKAAVINEFVFAWGYQNV